MSQLGLFHFGWSGPHVDVVVAEDSHVSMIYNLTQWMSQNLSYNPHVNPTCCHDTPGPVVALWPRTQSCTADVVFLTINGEPRYYRSEVFLVKQGHLEAVLYRPQDCSEWSMLGISWN